MTAAFDPNRYWLERGRTYASESRLSALYYREQERFFVETVEPFQPARILEAACGFGRVTQALAGALPDCRILAFDLSPEQLDHAPRLRNVSYACADLACGLHEGCQADVAVAAELFQHHPASVVRQFIAALLAAAPVLVHDFNVQERPGDPTAEHCFAHDWDALYCGLGVAFARKVSGPHGLIVARRAA